MGVSETGKIMHPSSPHQDLDPGESRKKNDAMKGRQEPNDEM